MNLNDRRVIALGFLTALMFCNRLWGAPPTIETLVSRVEVLSPDNERLNRFRLTLESPLPFEVPLVATILWERPDVYGMLVSAGEEQAPFWFLSQHKSMIFDVTSGEALISGNAAPEFIVEANDGTITIRYAYTSREKADVCVDFPSFLRDAVTNGVLDHTDNGEWRLTVRSRSGKTFTIAEFASSEPYTIRSLVVRSAKDDSLAFSIRDIRINDENDTEWPVFPAASSFPQTLTITDLKNIDVQPAANGFEVVAHGMRTLMAQGALRNPKWRTKPFLRQVDWDNAHKNNAEYGPKLRTLLGGRASEESDARETSAQSVLQSNSTPRSP